MKKGFQGLLAAAGISATLLASNANALPQTPSTNIASAELVRSADTENAPDAFNCGCHGGSCNASCSA